MIKRIYLKQKVKKPSGWIRFELPFKLTKPTTRSIKNG